MGQEEGKKDCAGGREQIRGGTGLTFKSRKFILGKEASGWHLGQDTSSSEGVIDLTREELKRKADQSRQSSPTAQSLGSRGQEKASSYGDLKRMKQSADEMVINLEQKIEECQKQVDEGKHRLRDFENIKQTDMEAVEKIKRVLEKLEKEKRLLEEKLMARTDLIDAQEQFNSLKQNQLMNIRKELGETRLKSQKISEQVVELQTAFGYDAMKLELELENLEKQIVEKKVELECPICFKLCAPPIYTCQAQHLICIVCRPKLRQCPSCMEVFKGWSRHRYAERDHEKLVSLIQQQNAIKSIANANANANAVKSKKKL